MPVYVPTTTPPGFITSDEVTVVLGEIILPGNLANVAPDAEGVTWGLTDITGWFEQAEGTGQIEQQPSNHGGWASPAYYGSRVIEVEGRLLCGSPGHALRALRRLESAIPLSATDTLVVAAIDGASQAQVRQHGPLLPDKSGLAFGRLTFSISLEAPDPRRYDTTQTIVSTGLPMTTGGMTLPLVLPLSIGATTVSGVLSVTNDGNMSTPPTFTVTGPCAPFSITHRGSGKTLRFADSVAAGRTLTIDTAKRRAVLDGTAARVVTGTWFEYEPGANEVAFSASSYDSGALLTSTSRSAWR